MLKKLVFILAFPIFERMGGNNTIIAISAFSGLIGAILAQGISGMVTYFSDRRKQSSEVKTAYRNKKTEIAENFFYVASEKVSIIRTHVLYWKKREFIDSETSLAFLNNEMKKLGEHLERLNADSWKYDLIKMNYAVALNHTTVIESNAVSQGYYLRFMDAIDAFKNAHDDEDKDEAKQRYVLILFEMCQHYEDLCKKMEEYMNSVNRELLNEFHFQLN